MPLPAFFHASVILWCALAAVAHAKDAEPASHDDRPDHRYAVIHRFAHGEGWSPASGLVQDRWGNLYGNNRDSSQGLWHNWVSRGCGLIYRIAPDGTESTVHDFSDHHISRGCRAWGELLLDGGWLYGVTFAGGKYGYGTVYRVNFRGGHQVLHHFNGADGEQPSAGLVRGSDGALYGTTMIGGRFGWGTVYKIALDGTFTSLYSFWDGDPLGSQPNDELTLGPDGALYGTASWGRYRKGTVFRLTTDAQMSLVHSFTGSDGDLPSGLTLGQDGWLYGAALAGGAHGVGTLYRLTIDGRFETLHSFNSQDGNGGPRDRPVQSADGTWYGTTMGTSPSRGALYRARFDGSDPTFLHVFYLDSHDGGDPVGPLLVGRDGGLYGATSSGGNEKLGGFGTGTVFRQGP